MTREVVFAHWWALILLADKVPEESFRQKLMMAQAELDHYDALNRVNYLEDLPPVPVRSNLFELRPRVASSPPGAVATSSSPSAILMAYK